MKRLAALFLVVFLLIVPTGAAAKRDPLVFRTQSERYLLGRDVEIRFVNHTGKRVWMGKKWALVDRDGNEVAQYLWPKGSRRVEPGDNRVWIWDQRTSRCYGECQNVWEGDPADYGRYKVRMKAVYRAGDVVLHNQLSTKFDIGTFFTVEFDSHPDASFVVFPNEREVIEAMRAELERPEEERQMVIGIVRARSERYNGDWSYVMGEGSMHLAEVAIEVCDASPYYVEENLDDWRGEQWCPWSSNVAHEGR